MRRTTAILRPFLDLLARVGALLVLAVAMELWLLRLTNLPPASYGRPVIVAALADRLASARPSALLAVAVMAFAVVAAVRHRSLGPRWDHFEHGARIRWLAAGAAGVLAWVYATYPYNFYFDRGHLVDRALVVALLPLLYWRPVFLFPFLLALLPVAWQFHHPIGGASWSAPILLVRALLLIGALWVTRLVTKRVSTADFVFLLCCLVAAHYWVSGVGKLELGWVGRDRIGFLLPATYANGWLGFLDPETIAAITKTLLSLNGLLQLGTLVLEVGALVALWRRNVLRAFLAGWILLHAAIFFLSGICFWHWMLLDAAILLLFFGRRAPHLPIFTPRHLLLSLLLIGGGALWFRPVRLAWLDSPVSYTYRLEATGASGQGYELAPRFFAPYDYQFTLSGFRYLTPAPTLRITWGAMWEPALAGALERATTPEQVLAVEAELGRNVFDSARSAAFDDFVRRFVGNWERRTGGPHGRGGWTVLRAPPLVWTFPRGTPPDPADPIRRVVVVEVTSLFDGERYAEIRRRPVRAIELTGPPAGAPGSR